MIYRIVLLVVVLLLSGCWEPMSKKEAPLPSQESNPLPIIGERFHDRKNDLHIWEMPHGWLVWKYGGYGGGLTFVPKP